MATIQVLTYDSLTNLNSTEGELTVIVKNLANQESLIRDQISLQQKTIHQLRIANVYNANVNDLIIDENIFENDETD